MPAVLYVYYKLPAAEHAAWVGPVEAVLRQLQRDCPGLQTELLQRPQAGADGRETWMEVHRHPDGVDEALRARIERAALDAGLPQPRACEVFVPLGPAAG